MITSLIYLKSSLSDLRLVALLSLLPRKIAWIQWRREIIYTALSFLQLGQGKNAINVVKALTASSLQWRNGNIQSGVFLVLLNNQILINFFVFR